MENIREILSKKTKNELLEIILTNLNNNVWLEKDCVVNSDVDNIDLEHLTPKQQQCYEIFEYYNKLNIKSIRLFDTKVINSTLKALKLYTPTQIKLYINRYKYILEDKNYFFNYKWNLIDFLNRKEGISSFTDNGSKWQNYIATRPTINTDIYFNAIWKIYPNKLSLESSRLEFDRKFIGLNSDEGKEKATKIYQYLKEQIESWNENEQTFIPKFDNWLRREIPN